MSGALCFAADTPEHIRAFYIDYGYAIYLLSVFPRKYTMAAMMIMTTKSPSMPCHIIVRAVPKFAIILALPLSEESEDDAAGNRHEVVEITHETYPGLVESHCLVHLFS